MDVHYGRMHYRRKRLYIALASALAALTVINIGILTGGVALALPIGGIGGFRIEADEVRLQNFSALPRIGDNSSQETAPALRNQADSAEIEGLVLSKRIPIPGTDQEFQISNTSDQTVTINGLIQDANALFADSFQADGFEVDEAPPSQREGFEQSFYQLAPDVTIVGLDSMNNYQFANSITIPGLTIEVDIVPEGSNPPPGASAPRPDIG